MSVRKGWILAVLVIFVLAGLGLVALGIVFSEKKLRVEPASTLVLDFADTVIEDLPTGGNSRFFFRDTPTMWDYLHALDRAADDPHVEAVLLRIDGVDMGWAKAEELRVKLAEIQERGTPVIAYIESGGDLEYMLASAAGVIYMAPNTELDLDGLASYETFFKGSLDKLGVKADFEHIGEYKSAGEPFTRTSMSDAAREASESLLDETWGDLVAAIGESRDMDSAAVAALIDRGPFNSKQARAAGLVDSLLYPDELEDLLPGGAGGTQVLLEDYLDVIHAELPVTVGPRVAVVHASGTIVSGESGTDPVWGRTVGADTFLDALDEAREEPGVRAIVVRIDSPGGEVYASHLMWRGVREAARELPVVASFSDLAASGGYYVAMGADTVLADRATLTGSIGVIGGKFDMSGLYSKVGIGVEVQSRGANAQFQSSLRGFTPAERERYRSDMFEEYQTFVGIVADNRAASVDSIDGVARGRVWTGGQAEERGLVDRIGGLEQAVAVARAMAGIDPEDEVRVETFPRIKRTFLQQVINRVLDEEDLGGMEGGIHATAGWPQRFLRHELALAGGLSRLAGGKRLALLPFTIDIR
jgi:protease-4